MNQHFPARHSRIPSSAGRRAAAGFTMTELMIAIAISAMLTAMAAPSFSGMIANHRGKAVASELYSTLSKARSLAIARNVDVTLSPKSGDWQNGWQIFDRSNSAVLLDDRGSTSGVTIAGPTNLIYRPSGRILDTSAVSFRIASGSGSNTSYQCVSVDLSGRPYAIAAATC